MANFYVNKGMNGFANWFVIRQRKKWIMLCYLVSIYKTMDWKSLSVIAKPDKKYKDLKEPLVEVLKHEEYVTDSINKIYTEALKFIIVP